jgi:hypothetical protein
MSNDYWDVSITYTGKVEKGVITRTAKGDDLSDQPEDLIAGLKRLAVSVNGSICLMAYAAKLMVVEPVGTEEGDLCRRDGCPGVIELFPDTSEGGECSCHIPTPCAFCLSTQPECNVCGGRDE